MSNELIAGRIQIEAEKAVASLLASLGQTKVLQDSYAYKYRVKPSDRLLEKEAIKKEDNQDYSLLSITDVIGIRFVTLFRSQMAEIVDQVLNIVCHIDPLCPNPFAVSGLEEVIIYRGNVGHDPLLDDIAKKIKEMPLADNLLSIKASKEGYSSIHIVARLSHVISSAGLDEYQVPVEIQIRTVFEDAWGEIDHKYGYPIRTGKVGLVNIQNPGSVLAHLKVLKSFSDACANYSEVILKDAHGELNKVDVDGDVISVEPDDSIIRRFLELSIARPRVKQYMHARKLKAAALVDGSSPNADKLAEAALCFEKITQDSEEHDLLYLYAKLNEAFCLLSSDLKEEVKAARGIYQVLKEDFADYPLIKHRLAQAHNKLGDYGLAVEEFTTAWVQVQEHLSNNMIGQDVLPEVDYDHMRTYLPKLLGYNLWLISRNKEGEDKLKYLEMAYEKSLPSLESGDQKAVFLIHNNLLYYLTELHQFFRDSIDLENLRERGLMHLDYIETHKTLLDDNDIHTLDTLARALFIFDRTSEAVAVAEKIISIVLSGDHLEASTVDALEIARDARKIIQGGLT